MVMHGRSRMYGHGCVGGGMVRGVKKKEGKTSYNPMYFIIAIYFEVHKSNVCDEKK